MATSVCPPAVERLADGADLPVHHPARRDDVGAGLGLGERGAGVALDRGVVVDHPVRGEDAAVPVVGVLVEAAVRHHDQPIADLVAQVPQRQLHDAVRVPGLGALGVLAPRDPEEDDGGHAERGELGHLLAQALPRVLDDAGQRGDGLRLVDPLPDEERRHQVVDREAGLGHEPAEGRRGAQAAGSVLGERHGADARTSREPTASGRLVDPIRHCGGERRQGDLLRVR